MYYKPDDTSDLDTEARCIEALRECARKGDIEVEHINADAIVVQALRLAGFAALAAEYERRTQYFWYA